MDEIARRRTFAIISHPDAGKTTLTEKLLLYGGAVHLAGAVRSRKNERATTSDWMELEKQRGISISSTVLQFDYAGHRVNLLDTPGHKDFSEDTYRVLTAVDAAVMVLDAAKGIEAQTLKLFQVCRRRRIPIFTFINKLDRPAREPLELLDEVERELGLAPFPMNWPLGMGADFKGVFERATRRVHLFERTPGGAYRAPVEVHDVRDPLFQQQLDARNLSRFLEETELLDHAGAAFDAASVLAGDTTPVFFGSASNNFGVQLLLDGFLRHAPPPGPRSTSSGPVAPDAPGFSAFIFKIQANMDPRHRDRVAFVRVCSGRFSRDMSVHHSGTGKRVRLANAHKLFGREREILDEAYAGDVLGLVGYPDFKIGDTLSEDKGVVFDEIPRFPPECFAYLRNKNPSNYKPFKKGLDQLILEGIVQPFTLRHAAAGAVLLAAVGPLQFEVLQYRLASEYGVEALLEPTPFEVMRWVAPADAERLARNAEILPSGAKLGGDAAGNAVVFFAKAWTLDFFLEKNPTYSLLELPPKGEPLVVPA